jgi:subtilisin family serine protease
MNVTVAVIDSGIDAGHPELANSIADVFDALGSKEGPHVHGTGVAGAIAAHSRLMGSAPEVRIRAIRAFGAASSGAESTSYVILKGLDYAALHGAQIVNMSFAGPKDTLIGRAVAATAARGIVLVAAAGNAGAKSPPLYPAANPNVIAVSGTDAQEKLFTASTGQPHRDRGAWCRYLPAGAGRQIPDDLRHVVFRRLRQRHRGANAGAQSCIEAERCTRNSGEQRARSRRAGQRRSVRSR